MDFKPCASDLISIENVWGISLKRNIQQENENELKADITTEWYNMEIENDEMKKDCFALQEAVMG